MEAGGGRGGAVDEERSPRGQRVREGSDHPQKPIRQASTEAGGLGALRERRTRPHHVAASVRGERLREDQRVQLRIPESSLLPSPTVPLPRRDPSLPDTHTRLRTRARLRRPRLAPLAHLPTLALSLLSLVHLFSPNHTLLRTLLLRAPAGLRTHTHRLLLLLVLLSLLLRATEIRK